MHNKTDREEMTEDILNYYTDTLKFPADQIFLVDSSGRGVKSIPKSNQVPFDQNVHCSDFSTSTALESCSLNKVSENDEVVDRMSKQDYTVKLTTKYKLPDICSIVHKGMDKDTNILVQNNHHNGWQNTEVWGVKSTEFVNTVRDIYENVHGKLLMEQRFDDMCANTKKCHRLKRLPNIARYKRGAGDILTNL
jgi:hypothetical protein